MTWRCSRCTYVHPADIEEHILCKICGTNRNWSCGKCFKSHEKSDAKKENCIACGAPRPFPSNKKQRTQSSPNNKENNTKSSLPSSTLSTKIMSPSPRPQSNDKSCSPERMATMSSIMARERNMWNELSDMDLEAWLKNNCPSRFATSDYSWIQVENADQNSPGYDHSREETSSFDVSAYQPALGKISNIIQRGERVSKAMKDECLESMKNIAVEQKCTVGKWMLFFKPDQADEKWEEIARATAQGKLGCSAKINPTKELTQDALCCIYTKNFADKDDVKRVLTSLKEMGFHVRSGYKPDFFTHLDIYRNNEWRLPVVIYSPKEVLAWGCGTLYIADSL